MNYAQTMLIQFTFFGTYFVMSIPAGRVVAHAGYKQGIVIGLLVAAAGALLFYPAAGAPSYLLFLVALFVLASGITLLQVAANPYISLLGDPRRASARLTLAQALNSLGTTLAPWLGGPVILAIAVLGPEALARLSPAQAEAYRIAAGALGADTLPMDRGGIVAAGGLRGSVPPAATNGSHRASRPAPAPLHRGAALSATCASARSPSSSMSARRSRSAAS